MFVDFPWQTVKLPECFFHPCHIKSVSCNPIGSPLIAIKNTFLLMKMSSSNRSWASRLSMRLLIACRKNACSNQLHVMPMDPAVPSEGVFGVWLGASSPSQKVYKYCIVLYSIHWTKNWVRKNGFRGASASMHLTRSQPPSIPMVGICR